MAQFEVWEKEYRQPQLITNSDEPQLDFKNFIKWLRKKQHVDLDGLRVLDLGSGTGKNSLFLAERGSVVTGVELSTTAVKIAKERAREKVAQQIIEKVTLVKFQVGDIGQPWPFANNSFDLILDVITSNSLSGDERVVYIKETKRVLAAGGHMFIKALCKDGDKNAENLLRDFPGTEKDTYIMPGTKLMERVFSKDDIVGMYEKYFNILHLERKYSYTKFHSTLYKRYFWLVYLQKHQM